MDVGFHSNFCFGWERRGLVSGSLLLVIWGGGGGLLFYNFFCGVGGWGWLALEFLGNKFYLIFFCFFLNNFLTFLPFFIIFFLFCGGTLLIFVQHSLIHSHNFFHVLLGSVSVRRCAFLFLGIDIQVFNCFWKIQVALRRAGLGATCAG